MPNVHLVGIGGAGLSAIAQVLLEAGYAVTGSDEAQSPFAAALAEHGATVHIGHAASNVNGRTFQVGGDEVGLYAEPDVVRSLCRDGGWDLDSLDRYAERLAHR